MRRNSNHDPDLRTDIEEDDDNIIYLTSIDLVDDKELERFELPTWVAHEPREVRRHNKGLCTKYNTMGLNRRRYYLLMVRNRHVSAEGKKILDQLDDCKKEVVLLQAMLTDINGSIFQMPDVLSKPMKLKKSSK
ncbi:hypothetical protein ACQJBY_061994 [Aegilops geniculata]